MAWLKVAAIASGDISTDNSRGEMLGHVMSRLRPSAYALSRFAERTLNETVIRVAVTGLSRSGKTVFITSLIQNLLALGQKRNTLPTLQSVLDANGVSR